MHIHVGFMQALGAFLSVIFFGFFWRIIASRNSDNAVGQAMAFIY